MGLLERIEGTAAARHRDAGPAALDDPEYAILLARARVRLHRMLEASLPETPELTPADVDMIQALERVGLPAITVVLFGQERIGARQIAARLVVCDGVARAQLGVAIMDEYGELTFREEQAPPPLAHRRYQPAQQQSA